MMELNQFPYDEKQGDGGKVRLFMTARVWDTG